MSSINAENKNGICTLFAEGRVDTANAAEVENSINELLALSSHSGVVLDVEKLNYISSAGLRVILRLKKKEPELKIVNASSDIYDVFEMTGFTDMMPVSKAYRRLSVEGCEIIGRGANGEVYRIDAETIIKVYKNADALPDIQREKDLARTAFIHGIPTAIPYDVVRVGEGYGSVFELLNASSFAKKVVQEPENADRYIELSVDLLKTIHGTETKPGELPDVKATVMKWAAFMKDYLPAPQFEKLYRLFDAVPQVNRVLHGDFHFKNIMLQDDEVMLIDMDTLCAGHPVFEMGSVFLAYQGFGESDHTIIEKFLGIPYPMACRIWEKTLQLYFGTEDADALRSYADKIRIVGYTRLIRREIRRGGLETEQGRKTIELATAHLVEALERVDTLEF